MTEIACRGANASPEYDASNRRERLVHLANLLVAHERATGALRGIVEAEIQRVEGPPTPSSRACTPPPPCHEAACPCIPGSPPVPRHAALTVRPAGAR